MPSDLCKVDKLDIDTLPETVEHSNEVVFILRTRSMSGRWTLQTALRRTGNGPGWTMPYCDSGASVCIWLLPSAMRRHIRLMLCMAAHLCIPSSLSCFHLLVLFFHGGPHDDAVTPRSTHGAGTANANWSCAQMPLIWRHEKRDGTDDFLAKWTRHSKINRLCQSKQQTIRTLDLRPTRYDVSSEPCGESWFSTTHERTKT